MQRDTPQNILTKFSDGDVKRMIPDAAQLEVDKRMGILRDTVSSTKYPSVVSPKAALAPDQAKHRICPGRLRWGPKSFTIVG